jgi:hypothetical protein
MREIRTSGSEGGRAGNRSAYPTQKGILAPLQGASWGDACGSGGRQKAADTPATLWDAFGVHRLL